MHLTPEKGSPPIDKFTVASFITMFMSIGGICQKKIKFIT